MVLVLCEHDLLRWNRLRLPWNVAVSVKDLQRTLSRRRRTAVHDIRLNAALFKFVFQQIIEIRRDHGTDVTAVSLAGSDQVGNTRECVPAVERRSHGGWRVQHGLNPREVLLLVAGPPLSAVVDRHFEYSR